MNRESVGAEKSFNERTLLFFTNLVPFLGCKRKRVRWQEEIECVSLASLGASLGRDASWISVSFVDRKS